MCDRLPGILIEVQSSGAMLGIIFGSLGTKITLSIRVLLDFALYFVYCVPLELPMDL